jgi:hypothetical protein
MPRQSEWLQHVPAALEALERLPCPVVDRETIEKLLHLKRRQAIRLLAAWGGFQSGKAYLIGREDCLLLLRSIRDGLAFQRDRSRRRRIGQLVSSMRADWLARQTVIPATQKKVKGLEDLPTTIQIDDRRLSIQFQNHEDLLTQLLSLVRALAHVSI